MDLVSFIPGIGPTALFTPGPTTPAPYNVVHTGLTDGTGPADRSSNPAEVYNRILLQIDSAVAESGLAADRNNWVQLPLAIEKMARDLAPPLSSAGNLIARAIFSQTRAGQTPIVLDSFNIASIAWNTGDQTDPQYLVTFSTPLPHNNWCSAYAPIEVLADFGTGPGFMFTESHRSTTSVVVCIFDNNTGGWHYTPSGFSIAIFG